MIERHGQPGTESLARAALARPIAEVAPQHHERLDRSGYPLGLRDDEIITPARIIAVAT
jgi:HD-GYP domain-containing protein (c-di-GMP phosphodiesterase class II)